MMKLTARNLIGTSVLIMSAIILTGIISIMHHSGALNG